jgi:2,3-dihydroxybenzoate decarboxylase
MTLQKIAVEEHFGFPEIIDDSQTQLPQAGWPKLRQALLDVHGRLLEEMDACGVQTAILSLASPGIQAIPEKRRATEIARRANDYLADIVAKTPDRFQALAALPMQDPEAASQELVRCVKELGFKGLCVNGFSQVDRDDSAVYCDLPQYWPFWANVESLGVPFYLHPRIAPARTDLDGHPWFRGAAWSFGVETATHALRLMASGLFDTYPKLTAILGHLGETLPNTIWRIEHRLSVMPRGIPAQRPLGEYLRNNFYFATSGNFSTKTLLNAILEVGAGRILFAADYPFEKISEAADWLDNLDAISETDRLKIARTNAENLFRLRLPASAAPARLRAEAH